ncbi:hypothetical protein C0995_009995, partial [Termitomyces sp. Mi166
MTSKTLELNPTHPLVFELSSLRLADEAYTTSVKLQRCSLESANAHDRATYLERENEVLRTELAILRANPHPDASPQAHPAVAQVQQLTLSLRKLSDKLSLTEAALLERTTQLSHTTAEAGKAKLTAEAAYELAARTRGREEAGKLRELELEQKVKAAEEAVKMSDLVVNEYADLVRSLQDDKSHERLVDGLAEGKLGLQRLFKEFNVETTRLQKELLEAQQALAVADSQRNSEKKHLEQSRVELAQAQFELQQLKIDDNVAAKMVSRYMYVFFPFVFPNLTPPPPHRKFSQQSTDNLSKALSSLKTRHSATTSTLSSQLLSLRSQLHVSTTQTEILRRALDELGGELAKEAFGRRREVGLRIRMVNREEKVRGELERWVLKVEEAWERERERERVRAEDVDDEDDGGLRKMIDAARKLLEETFGGEDGEVGRMVITEAAVRELMLELEREIGRRLELEKIVALAKVEEASAVGDGTVGDDDDDEVSKKLEKQTEAPDDLIPDSTSVPVATFISEILTPEAKSSDRPIPDDLAPLTNTTTPNGTHEPPSEQHATFASTYTDTPNNKDEKLPHPLPTSAQLPPIPNLGTSVEATPFKIPMKEDAFVLVPETSLPTIAETEISQKPAPEDLTPVARSTSVKLEQSPTAPLISTDTPNDKDKRLPHSSPADSQFPSIPDPEKSPNGIPADIPDIPVQDDTSPLPTVVEAESSYKPTAFANVTTGNGVREYLLDAPATSLPILGDIPDEEKENATDRLPTLSRPSSIPSSIPNGTKVPSADIHSYPEVSTRTIVQPLVITTPPDVSSNSTAHQQDLSVKDGKVTSEEDVSSNKSNNMEYHLTPETEHESPPAPIPLHDRSSPLPSRPTSVESDPKPSNPCLPISNALLPCPTPAPSPPTISVDGPSPAHPLLADLARTKHRYDSLQRSLRDCHLALESLSVSLESVAIGRVPVEALRTAAQRLSDYTEDARVELEIRIADEEIVGKGFEMMLCVPGALTTTPSLGLEKDGDQDVMTHSDLENQVEAFVKGTDPSVNKAVRNLSRKLEDIEHDIAVLQRAVHDDDSLLSPSPSIAAAANGG